MKQRTSKEIIVKQTNIYNPKEGKSNQRTINGRKFAAIVQTQDKLSQPEPQRYQGLRDAEEPAKARAES